jgi:hypothetical protein
MPSQKMIGGNIISDADPLQVRSLGVGTGAADLGKAEDAPHTSGDVGLMVLGVRNSALVALTNTDGDYSPFAVDDRGRLLSGLSSAAFADGDANGIARIVFFGGSGQALAVHPALYNGATLDRQRTPNVFKPIAPTAVAAGTGITIWTPAAGKKVRLMGYCLSVTVAADVIFGDNAVGTVIFRTGILAANNAHEAPSLGNGVLSSAANNVLKLDVSASGTVQGVCWGTEE